MPNLSIKDVPEAWAEALRQRAARNHRSLQGELMALVEQAVQQETEVPTSSADPANPGAPRIVGLDPRGRPIVQRGWKTIEQIAAEQRARGRPPANGAPLGVDIIREDRDSR
jgi:plasmid stability protein